MRGIRILELGALQLRQDDLEHTSGILHDLVVPKSKFTNPCGAKLARASLIASSSRSQIVTAAAQFNCEARFQTKEIDDAITDTMLPTKLESGELSTSQSAPQ